MARIISFNRVVVCVVLLSGETQNLSRCRMTGIFLRPIISEEKGEGDMLKSKSFIVEGNTIHRNGIYEKDIAQNVDKAINDFLEKTGGKYVDLKTDVKVNPGVGRDVAFVTIIVETDGRKKSE